ncbi:MAG: MATE family efflux transporter [Culicoidibacterales bacterium]
MAKINLVTAPIGKTFLRYLIPSIIAVVSSSAYIFFDTAFIGLGVGADGLAALNFAIPVFNLYLALGLMCGIGGATLLAHAKGRNDEVQQNYWYTLSFIVNLIIGCLLSIGLTFWLSEFITLLGTPPQLFELVTAYLQVIVPFSWLFSLNYVCLVMVRNDGKPQLAMVAMVIGSLLNILLDWWFVIGLQQGMQGAALATLCSPVFSVLILGGYLFSKNATVRFRRISLKLADVKTLLFSGSATFVMEISAAVIIIVFNGLLQQLSGSLAVSAYSIIANLAIMVIAVFNGVAQDVQPLVSTNFGANQIKRCQQVLRYAVLITGTIGVVSLLISWLNPELLIAFFNNDTPTLIPIAREAIQLYAIAFIFAGINMVFIAYLQAMQQTRVAFLASFARGFLFIAINLCWLVPLYSVRGVWLTIPITEGMIFVILVSYLYQTQFKKS